MLYERGKMDRISKIKERILHLFNEDVSLYDMNFVTRDGMYILEIQINRNSAPVDLDLCSDISNAISPILDELDCIEEDYYLEVCSAGAEREIRDENELLAAVGQYIYVKLINPEKGLDEVLGTLLSKDDEGNLSIEHFIKGVRKKTVINIENISYISHAVKV